VECHKPSLFDDFAQDDKLWNVSPYSYTMHEGEGSNDYGSHFRSYRASRVTPATDITP
jgi:hypothetical protein